VNIVKTSSGAEHKIRPFLKDVEPFFYRRPVVYVDAGAYTGAVFREVQAVLKPVRAYLVEPNPASYARLKETVAELGAERAATCYNLALGARAGTLRLRARDTMTRVLDPAEAEAAASSEADFEIPARSLDALAADFLTPHVSLLKIDVEGFETEVLEGAKGLLADQAIDMIYVEAGLEPGNRQQTYYREIEDRLRVHGYRLYRIYEQQHEWTLDAPTLRRMNLAFISPRFAEGAPFRLSKELFSLRAKHADLEARLAEREEKLAERARAAEGQAEALAALRDELAERTGAAAAEAEALKAEASARERAASEAAAAAEAALRAALAEREAALEALRQELEGERRARAAAERAAAERAAAEAATARDRLARLEAYAGDLETRHVAMLESETWRAMEPARRLIRLVTGRKTPAPFVPRFSGDAPAGGALPAPGQKAAPKSASKPAPGPASGAAPAPTAKAAKLTPEAARAEATALIGLTGKRDYVALVARERAFANMPQSDQNFFLSRFCKLVAMGSLSAYSEVAGVADEIALRLGRKHGWIVSFFGEAVYVRYVSDAAMALTRVGRYEEGRRLIDEAVERLDGAPALLQLRAEVCWPHAPEQALADIAECRRKDALNEALALLEAYVETMVAGGPAPSGDRLAQHPQMPLVVAAAALRDGDFAAYRDHLNGHFAAQGLMPPIPEGATEFSFGALAGATVSEDGADRSGPLVSVVMTTYNSAATLDYAVASLRAQTHGNLEILIVDDGSTDGTREMLATAAAADPRIRVLLNDENVGTYCSKNRAIAEAKGAYVTLHDSDDWAHPERIARHVALMEKSKSLMASRSEWLRIEADGTPAFRRWGRRFQHPNPASAFYRRKVFDQVGFFDSVRFGADSEHWYRMRRVLGPGRTKSLSLCLGFGSIRADSLTRSGDGAMDKENYSPVRGAYAASYFYWHATADPADMRLSPRVRTRAFAAPPEMAVPPPGGALPAPASAGAGGVPSAIPSAGGEPEFMFGISLASARTSADWGRAQELLGHTLRSVLNQSDPRFSVVICGHERPDLPELDDPRVRFLESDQGPARNPTGFRGDKMRKRRIIGALLRARGGGYFFPLDADDLVHRDVVAHVRRDDNRRGYLIDRGYTLDYNNGTLAPVPGAWSVSFDRGCGSSAVIWFDPADLPVDSEFDEDLYFNLFQSHAYWPIVAEEYDRRLDPLPFPGGVYVVNHAQNLSFRLQRKGVRVENIVRAIERNRIEEADALLAEDFGMIRKKS